MDSELRNRLDIEAIIYDKRPDLVQTYLNDVEAARKVANPDLTMLDGYPDLYEIGPKQLAALETLGVNVAKVPNAYIIFTVTAGITSAPDGHWMGTRSEREDREFNIVERKDLLWRGRAAP